MALARAAARASSVRGGPVYVSTVAAAPSHAMHLCKGCPPTVLPFHAYDIMAAIWAGHPGDANQEQRIPPALLRTTSRERAAAVAEDPAAVVRVVPGPSDLALGHQLLGQWRAIAEARAPGWPSLDATPNGSYVHGVIHATVTEAVADYKTVDCASLQAAGIGEVWWWDN